MKKYIGILSFGFIFLLQSFTYMADKHKPAYVIFTSKGKDSNFSQLLKKAQEADVILFGEYHNNPISHWLQLELARELTKDKKGRLVFGAEMFESDVQVIMNEFLSGMINEKTFRAESRPWVNYPTDIKPLVEFAKENNIPFVATNVPRRYANMVFHSGLEALERVSEEAKHWLPPLPIKYDPSLKGYAEIHKATGGHGTENLPKSQALKDATMSHFILKNRKEGQIFLHFNGTYHSNNYEGIYWYLKQENPNLKILTIATVEQPILDDLKNENLGLADFIIATPENMAKTH
jgi:uncharacterized iron-regulated protein